MIAPRQHSVWMLALVSVSIAFFDMPFIEAASAFASSPVADPPARMLRPIAAAWSAPRPWPSSDLLTRDDIIASCSSMPSPRKPEASLAIFTASSSLHSSSTSSLSAIRAVSSTLSFGTPPASSFLVSAGSFFSAAASLPASFFRFSPSAAIGFNAVSAFSAPPSTRLDSFSASASSLSTRPISTASFPACACARSGLIALTTLSRSAT